MKTNNFIKEPGTYTVTVNKVELKTSKKGNPMVCVEYKTLTGQLVSDFLMLDGKGNLKESAEKSVFFIKKAAGVGKLTDAVGKTIQIQLEKRNDFLSVVSRQEVAETTSEGLNF